MEAFLTDGLRSVLANIPAEEMSEYTVRWPGHIQKFIDQRDSDGKLLFASQDGEKIQLNTKNLLISYLKHPLMTFKVISAIHFEALRLWVKRIKFIKKVIKIKNNVSFEK